MRRAAHMICARLATRRGGIMPSRLVSRQSLSEALEQLGEESLVTPSAFEESPVSDAELRANLTEAMQVLEAEGGEPGVMVTAQNQLASLLQSLKGAKT
jgi:hypothetical protein